MTATSASSTVQFADYPERELLLVKGSVPGPRGGLVVIRDAVKGAP